jgi:hypothetical protein
MRRQEGIVNIQPTAEALNAGDEHTILQAFACEEW